MGDITWVEEGNNGAVIASRKRKARPKKYEFVGWGSRQLIQFLKSLGKDTTEMISRYEVSEIIARYIAKKGLLDPSNKKKVICDVSLILLFGSKTIFRMKVYDLLEKHYKENQDDLDFDYLYEDEPQFICHSEKIANGKAKVVKKPKGTFAAIVSDNIKLVYLRKSLVQELVKSPDTFDGKMLGSFVRIKSDPNDYLQKNPYQLVQVTGVKKEHGTDDFLLQVTNYIKDVSISVLSDDNFSQEECEDLHQRIENNLLKKPTIVEIEEKARSLHEDQTKHWLGREIILLQRLIDRANEKGWRREVVTLSEYLEKRELLENPEEQSRLLSKVPEVIGEELVPKPEASPEADKSDSEQRQTESPLSSIQETPEVPRLFAGEDKQCNGYLKSKSNQTPGTPSYAMESNGKLTTWIAYAGDEYVHGDEEQPAKGITGGETPTKESEVSQLQSTILEIDLNNGSQAKPNPSEIIELSDDDDNEEDNGETLHPRGEDVEFPSYDKEKLNWLYKDPQGHIQGPFSIHQLKQWSDAEYFTKTFKVWMAGQSMQSAILLTDVLRRI